MLIRVATTRADIPRTGEGIAFVHGEIEPKISAMDGNRGFAMAVDRSAGRYVGIAAWTDREALEASDDDAPGLITDLAQRLHGSKPSVEVFDLSSRIGSSRCALVTGVGLRGWRYRCSILPGLCRDLRKRYWRSSSAMKGWPASSCLATALQE
jgi:hypothetical protein